MAGPKIDQLGFRPHVVAQGSDSDDVPVFRLRSSPLGQLRRPRPYPTDGVGASEVRSAAEVGAGTPACHPIPGPERPISGAIPAQFRAINLRASNGPAGFGRKWAGVARTRSGVGPVWCWGLHPAEAPCGDAATGRQPHRCGPSGHSGARRRTRANGRCAGRPLARPARVIRWLATQFFAQRVAPALRFARRNSSACLRH